MEMFAGKFKFDKEGNFDPDNGEVPRANYDEILWAIVTVFQIMIGDQWNMVMYQAYSSSSKSAVSYFFFLVLFGKIILLNLFLAILLGYFEQASLMIREDQENQLLEQFKVKSNKVGEVHTPRQNNEFAMKLQPV